MAQFPTTFTGPDVFLISVDERAKHDQQFLSLSPTAGGYITGDQARNFFLQSGLPPPILAQIWALADMNSDGRMDIHEFSIAMKLIKLKLQGHPLPSSLPPSMITPLALPPQSGFGMPPMPPLSGMMQPIPGFPLPAPPVNKSGSFNRPSAKLQKGPSVDVASVLPPCDWAVPQSSRLKYRQLFNSHDKMMSGHLTGPQARTILMQSSLPQGQLATIWSLSDIDQDGKLTAEEFILAMHLIDMAMSGLPLPPVLPPDYLPPTFRRVRMSFEDKKRENFERGNLELEKRRQALQELQRKEQERLAALEREEYDRKERERMEQERRRQHELEKQLLSELLTQRNREQESIVLLKARKKTLEFELEALNDKKCQLEGKLKDVRFRLSAQRREVEQTNQTRETRIAEITLLQQQLQDSQQWLGRLIPDKQGLNDQLKQVQQNSLHRDSLSSLQKARETRAKLLEIDAFNTQLKSLCEFYANHCSRIEALRRQLQDEQRGRQELREIHSRQQRKSAELQDGRLSAEEGMSWREEAGSSASNNPTPPSVSAPHAWLNRMIVEKGPVPNLFEQKTPVSSFDQQTSVKVVYYRALYPFDARSHDEISIAPGRRHHGTQYKHKLNDHTLASLGRLTLNDDELAFLKSQVITVLNKDDCDWWKGELNGREGLFPSNYVKLTTDTDPSTQWCADLHLLDMLSPIERKRQGYIHELIVTEENYANDLQLVTEIFHKPLLECELLTEKEVGMIFVNWKELIMALRVRKKMSGDRMPVKMIGDILTNQLPHMQPYIRFCSCQLNGATLIQQKTDDSPEIKDFLKRLAMDPRCKGMPLSSFLLKPMQRVTRYPLIIKNIIENTPESHPDNSHLKAALEKAEELCSQVNEGVREKENSDRLEWIQAHVQCEGLSEQLVFNSVTNCLGPRKFLHSGKLFKAKSSKELYGFLFNDFLLLTQVTKPLGWSGSDKVFSSKTHLQYRMYKTPIFLNEVLVKLPTDPSGDEPLFHISHIDRVYTLRAESINERTAWVQKIKAASELFIETEKKKREKAYLVRSQRATGIGRLMVNIVEGIELKPCRSHGKSNPYCEVTMGSQCHITKTLQDTLNPKWNSNCQFFIKDLEQDVLCVTVFERDQFSPDDFLGRTEIRLAEIKKDQGSKGPITKRLLLHEVPTGEIVVRLDLQLFEEP
ncbi:hypothetical protein JOQ06_020322 [Pogonophryne albipinna]|uniref:Intersectin-1-like n=1 Tax=Pogonophryne albipinna TaxID=1090488 RepID=A0AAD6FWP4_9TELE|nr:hypothetical protein JOQ06_020322 [Pogonophryne albipinna]